MNMNMKNDFKTILPLNSTAFETAAEEVTTAVLENLRPQSRYLWNPGKCPEHLLSHLAWALSVDVWDNNWDVDVKREVLKNAYEVHSVKGTIGALRTALKPVKYQCEIVEWFQKPQSSSPKPYTFDIKVIATNGQNFSERNYLNIIRIINAAKNARSHFNLKISNEIRGIRFNKACTVSGELVKVYPFRIKEREVKSFSYKKTAIYVNDQITIRSK